MEKDKYIRFDWAMKRLLRNKADFSVLEGLLTVLMGEKITILEFLESEANQEEQYAKFNRVDIKARDSKGEIIIVEIQNTHEIHFLERILYGVSKAVTEHIGLGETYRNVKKVISISILYFDLGKGKDYVYHGTTRFVGIHSHDELEVSDKERNAIDRPRTPRDIFPEYYLLRVNEFNDVARTPLEEWVRYLKTGEIDDNAQAPGLPEARQQLKYYDMSAAERKAYRDHVDDLMILQESIEDSEKRGEKNKAHEIARNMKQMGLDASIISKVTGLTEEEIKQL